MLTHVSILNPRKIKATCVSLFYIILECLIRSSFNHRFLHFLCKPRRVLHPWIFLMKVLRGRLTDAVKAFIGRQQSAKTKGQQWSDEEIRAVWTSQSLTKIP